MLIYYIYIFYNFSSSSVSSVLNSWWILGVEWNDNSTCNGKTLELIYINGLRKRQRENNENLLGFCYLFIIFRDLFLIDVLSNEISVDVRFMAIYNYCKQAFHCVFIVICLSPIQLYTLPLHCTSHFRKNIHINIAIKIFLKSSEVLKPIFNRIRHISLII